MSTDREIQKHVLDALEWEPGVRAEHVGVSVDDGVVTLQGFVTTLREKYLAERTVCDMRGVRAVANDIAVAPVDSKSPTDSAIAAAAAAVLEWDTALAETSVKAVVRSGWLTLEGSVGWAYQRDAAERAVRNLTGVKGISNAISIHAVADAGDVKTGIERAFQRSATLDASRIRVEAHDGTVVLTGTVRSLAELDAAERAAWAAPGVTDVDDHLVVMPSVVL
jgi:osmotically-inducible protein OsmY